jgi:flavodoxin
MNTYGMVTKNRNTSSGFKGYTVSKLMLFLMLTIFLALPSFSLAQQHEGAKILILYYSLTGNTKASCEALQKILGTDILEIKDLRNRSGKWGFFKTAIASLIGRPTKIEPEHPNLSSYSFIILGSPIWTGKLSMAIRTLVDRNRFDGKKVVIFTTTNAYEKEKYKEKSRNLVRRAGGEVVGYYQVLASEEREGKDVARSKEKIVEDTLKYVPEIQKAFFLVP